MEEGAEGERKCFQCSIRGWKFRKVFAVSPFDGPMAVLIRQFKFRRRIEVAALGGQLLAAVLRHEAEQDEYDLLLPVPLHIRRLRQRGFNQSLLLAREVGRIMGITVSLRALRRHRWTAPQVGLDEKSRRENVRGAFQAAESARIRDKKILLIDDVFTTGCTVNECAGTLMASGARAVDAMTLARVV
jgi:ComF family protein